MGQKERIRRLRIQNNMTQEELARLCGVSRTAVTQWESGTNSPRSGAVEKMAVAFRVAPSFITYGDSGYEYAAVKLGQPMASVPILGDVHAGTPEVPTGMDCTDSALVPQFLLDTDPDCYAVRVVGACMSRVYPENALVVVSPNSEPQNGSVAVVTIDGGETVMRRMYRTAQTLVLSPDSYEPGHEDIVVRQGDGRSVSFGGKVVWYQSPKPLD